MSRNWSKILIAGCFCVFVAGLLPAAENHWTGAGNDSLWTNPANWSLGILPDASQDVFIERMRTNVILNGSAEAGSLSLGGERGLVALDITGGTLHCFGPASVQTNGLLNLLGQFAVDASLQIDGTMNWAAGALEVWGTTAIGPSGHLDLHAPGANRFYGNLCNYGTVSCWATNLMAMAECHLTNNGTFVLATNLAFTRAREVIPNFGTTGRLWSRPTRGALL